jgi:hypothetical protein
MSKILTFVDASVLINAAVGKDKARKQRAQAAISDNSREYVATEFLRLEVLLIAIAYKSKTKKERELYETFFDAVSKLIEPAPLIKPAYKLACKHALGALDALHIAAAKSINAEFICAERLTKPIYRAYSKIISIY